MFLKTNQSILNKYLDLFHSEITKKYFSLMEVIRHDNDPDTRKKANDELLMIFHLNHIPIFQRYVIRENNKETVKKYQSKMRKSGKRPYVIHPISVEYLLSLLGLGTEIYIAAANHDNIEEDISDKKKNIGGSNIHLLDEFTNVRFAREYKKLAGVLKKALARMKKDGARVPEELTLFEKKNIFFACLIVLKVTRFESDSNYSLSIGKIVDENINITNPQFRLLFLEYLRDISHDSSIREADLDKYNDQLTLSKEEICNIIVDAFLVKLGDRISNSLDTYEKQIFSEKITVLFKNFIVLDAVRRHLKGNLDLRNYVVKTKYEALNLLSDLLLYVCNEKLVEEIEHFDAANFKNEAFHQWRKETDIAEKIKEYSLSGGFRVVDQEVQDNVVSGLIMSIFNRTLNKDESVSNLLDVDATLQYRALESLKGVFHEYSNPDFTIDNIDIIRDYSPAKLG